MNYCTQCGNQVDEGSFCSRCGTRLADADLSLLVSSANDVNTKGDAANATLSGRKPFPLRAYIAAAIFVLMIVFDAIVLGMTHSVLSTAANGDSEIGSMLQGNSTNLEVQLTLHKLHVIEWCLSLAILAWIGCTLALVRFRDSSIAASLTLILMAAALTSQWYASLAGSTSNANADLPVPSPYAVIFWYIVVLVVAFSSLRQALLPIRRVFITAISSVGVAVVIASLVGLSGHGLATKIAAAEARPAACEQVNQPALQQAVQNELLQDSSAQQRDQLEKTIKDCATWADSTGESELIQAYQPLVEIVEAIDARPADCVPITLTNRLQDDASNNQVDDIKSVAGIVAQCVTWSSSSESLSAIHDRYVQLADLIARDTAQVDSSATPPQPAAVEVYAICTIKGGCGASGDGFDATRPQDYTRVKAYKSCLGSSRPQESMVDLRQRCASAAGISSWGGTDYHGPLVSVVDGSPLR